jgi:hypothetical protein
MPTGGSASTVFTVFEAEPQRLFEKYYMKPIISKNLTPLPPFPTREWGF